MPLVRRVTAYPESVKPDRVPIDQGRNVPDYMADAFSRASRGVCERYSDELRAAGIEGPRAHVRVTAAADLDGWDGHAAELRVLLAPPVGTDEWAFVRLPQRFRALTPDERALVVLDVVHLTMLTLAEVRGWDVEALEACRARTATDPVYRWQSDWKASPGRRHEARLVFRLPPDDGFARAWLEVRDRRSHDEDSRSGEAVAWCHREGFARSARTLRWHGSDHLVASPFYSGLWRPGGGSGLLEGRLIDGEWGWVVRDDVAVRQPERITWANTAPVPVVLAESDLGS